MTYGSVHHLLRVRYGRAVEHPCLICDGPAKDWAYLYNGDPELYAGPTRSPYSEDPDCYAPMCRKCHRGYDTVHDDKLREALRQNGVRQMEVMLKRREEDPDFMEKMRATWKGLGESIVRRRLEDPDFAETQRIASAKNMLVGLRMTKERMLADPEYAAHLSRVRAGNARATNAKTRRCIDCGLTAHPAAVGAHLSSSGHSGYESVGAE